MTEKRVEIGFSVNSCVLMGRIQAQKCCCDCFGSSPLRVRGPQTVSSCSPFPFSFLPNDPDTQEFVGGDKEARTGEVKEKGKIREEFRQKYLLKPGCLKPGGTNIK